MLSLLYAGSLVLTGSPGVAEQIHGLSTVLSRPWGLTSSLEAHFVMACLSWSSFQGHLPIFAGSIQCFDEGGAT
jgi:hypothetical protein